VIDYVCVLQISTKRNEVCIRVSFKFSNRLEHTVPNKEFSNHAEHVFERSLIDFPVKEVKIIFFTLYFFIELKSLTIENLFNVLAKTFVIHF